MIVSEFIEWLKTQPQNAIVEVLQHSSGSSYYEQGGCTWVEPFTLEGTTVGETYIISDFYDVYEFKGDLYLQLGMKDV